MEHMEDLNALDFNMTQEMHPKDVSPMQKQKIDHDDPFYVPILDHLMGATQVLGRSQTQFLDAKNKIASNFDDTMVGENEGRWIKGRIPREGKFKAWWL